MKPFVGKMAKVIRQEAAAHKLIEGVLLAGAGDRRFQQPKGCKGAGHCALGALALAAGVSNRQLWNMAATPHFFPQVMHKKLWEAYRIDTRDMQIILDANDDVPGCTLDCTDAERVRRINKRRDKVLKAIEKVGKSQRQRNPNKFGWP